MGKGSDDSNRTGSMDRRKFLVLASSAVAAGASAFAVPRVRAQGAAYPTRPISLVVPYAPGTAPDVVGRIIASGLPTHLGQNVIVENKPGAGGSIGTAAVARAKNDGHTLCMASPAAMAIDKWLYRNLPYDPIQDLTPVIKLVSSSAILLVPPKSPATSVQDLMRLMKERKQGNYLQYTSLGNGTLQHLESVMLTKLAGANADHVPYRNNADQLAALANGQVDFSFVALTPAISFVKNGRVRALGITSDKPSPLLPDVPSLSSVGLEGFDKTGPWFGVVGPRDMPDAVVQTLHQAFVKALGNPDIQARLAAAGVDLVPPAPPNEFALFIRDQVAFWGDLVKASGVSIE